MSNCAGQPDPMSSELELTLWEEYGIIANEQDWIPSENLLSEFDVVATSTEFSRGSSAMGAQQLALSGAVGSTPNGLISDFAEDFGDGALPELDRDSVEAPSMWKLWGIAEEDEMSSVMRDFLTEEDSDMSGEVNTADLIGGGGGALEMLNEPLHARSDDPPKTENRQVLSEFLEDADVLRDAKEADLIGVGGTTAEMFVAAPTARSEDPPNTNNTHVPLEAIPALQVGNVFFGTIGLTGMEVDNPLVLSSGDVSIEVGQTCIASQPIELDQSPLMPMSCPSTEDLESCLIVQNEFTSPSKGSPQSIVIDLAPAVETVRTVNCTVEHCHDETTVDATLVKSAFALTGGFSQYVGDVPLYDICTGAQSLKIVMRVTFVAVSFFFAVVELAWRIGPELEVFA